MLEYRDRYAMYKREYLIYIAKLYVCNSLTTS